MCVCVYVCVCVCFSFTAGHSPIMCSLSRMCSLYLECGLSTTSVFSRVLSCSLVFCVLFTTSVFSRALSCSLVFYVFSLPRAKRHAASLAQQVSFNSRSLFESRSHLPDNERVSDEHFSMRPLFHTLYKCQRYKVPEICTSLGLGYRVQGLGFRVQGLRCRVQAQKVPNVNGIGFRVQALYVRDS